MYVMSIILIIWLFSLATSLIISWDKINENKIPIGLVIIFPANLIYVLKQWYKIIVKAIKYD